MTKRFRRWLRRRLAVLGLIPFAFGCAASPCSPRSALALDASCAQGVVEVWSEVCPDAAELEACPEAVAALAACDLAIAAHARRCAR